MLAICHKALPGWSQLQQADVEFTTVSGGISNINAKLAPTAAAAPGLEPVMFKVFGDKTEQIIDRDAEKVVVVALGEQGFGPQVLALFGNGRIEQWLHCVAVSPPQMCSPELVPRIARQLARFHSIQVELPRQPHTPWGVIRDWLGQARSLKFSDPVKQAAYEAIDFDALAAEVAETEAACALTHSPLVFGHNDLLSGNILLLQAPGFDPASPDPRGRVVFIDYEYGAYTYRDYDIANHFAEYAGFDGDYTRYPGKQQQELFFRHYLAEEAAGQTHARQQQHHHSECEGEGGCGCLSWMHKKQPGSPQAQQQPQQPQPQQQQQQQQLHRLGSMEAAGEPGQLPPLPPQQLDRLSASVNVWALASHLYWGIWAVIQACNSPIDFDYMRFHQTRLAEYHRRKPEFISEALRVFRGGAGGGEKVSANGRADAPKQQEQTGGAAVLAAV